MNIIWHYTSCIHLEGIINAQKLKVSEADRRFGFKPAVWFSKNQMWEPTASKMATTEEGKIVTLSPSEQLKTIGMVRIGIEHTNELVSWAKYKHVGKIPLPFYERLEEVGKQKGGKPADWYCLFRNVESYKWVTVEQYVGSEWLKISPKN